MLKGTLIVTIGIVIVAAAAVLALLGSTDSGRADVPHDHDLAIKKVVGAKDICTGTNTTAIGGYTVQLRNNSPARQESGEIGIIIDPVIGTGGSGPTVTSVNGASVNSSTAVDLDADDDIEYLVTATVNLGATGTTVVTFKVAYPACGVGPDVSPIDYMIFVDLCHRNDASKGLFGVGNCAAGSVDGGADPHTPNDATITVLVNDEKK